MRRKMKRRAFITLLGGTAAAWPLAARAQQRERMRRIGVLMYPARDDPEGQARIAAFQDSLEQLGWTDGRNVRIDIRWPAGFGADRVRQDASELVAAAPDVILATGNTTTAPLQQLTRTVPITPSARATSRAWHGPAAILPASPSLTSASQGNG